MKWTSIAMAVLMSGSLAGTRRALAKAEPYGVVTYSVGEATLLSVEDTKPKALKAGASLFVGDRIKTGANGRVNFVLIDGTQVKLNFNTDISLHKKEKEGEKNLRGINALKILIGDIWSKVAHNANSSFDIETPSAVAAVKGSSGQVTVDGSETACIHWHDGTVLVSNDLGSSTMKDQQELCVSKGQKPPQAHNYTPSGNQWFAKGGGQYKSVKIHLRSKDGSAEGDLTIPVKQ